MIPESDYLLSSNRIINFRKVRIDKHGNLFKMIVLKNETIDEETI